MIVMQRLKNKRKMLENDLLWAVSIIKQICNLLGSTDMKYVNSLHHFLARAVSVIRLFSYSRQNVII